MADRLKKIPIQLKEQWNKYSSKQKTIIVSVIAAVFLALIILYVILSRTHFETLLVCETPKDASKVAELL